MPRVMVVEDDAQVRAVWRAILEEAGYRVAEAKDGIEAERIQKDDPTALIVTDLLMPERDGLETIMHIRRFDPQVKFIAVTGGCRILRSDLLRQASLLGATRTFQKPLSAEKLLEAVDEMIGPPDPDPRRPLTKPGARASQA